MSRPNLAQQQAVEHRGSVTVTAGAGTGKTRLLAARYLHHLTTDGHSPLAVVAVTFTERAAAELRERIRAELGDQVDADRLAELEAAPIGTIHSLAGRICREHPAAAGVAPGFRVLGNDEVDPWSTERLDDILTGLPLELYGDLPWSLAREAARALLKEPYCAALALGRLTRPWPVVAAEWEEIAARLRAEAEASLFGPAWADSVAFLRSVAGRPDDKLEVLRQQLLDLLDRLDADVDLASRREVITAIAGLKVGNVGAKGNWSIEPALVRRQAIGLRDAARDATTDGDLFATLGPADATLHRWVGHLAEVVAAAGEHLAAGKRRAGVLSFADLETGALRALDEADVRPWYAARWRAILVDEAQDTNPTQAALLRRLAGLDPAPTMTFVGDPKQMIYGFRGVSPEQFGELREMAPANVDLEQTYRHHVPLVERFNTIFDHLLGELSGPTRSDREPPDAGWCLRLALVDADDDGNADRCRQVEAAWIAEEVTHWLESGLPVRDGDTCRPARAGDIAVLARAWAALDPLVEALAAVGVRALHAGGGSLLATREARDGLALLRWLADPTDTLALAAVLRGPLVAVDDPTLDRLARSAEWALPEPARAVLEPLREAAARETPSRLLQLADRLTGWTAQLARLPGPERRLADWHGFVGFVRETERSNPDLLAVTRAMTRLIDQDVEIGRPPLEADDAVALMTIHAAKGLEWPIVIVPDLARKSNARGGRVRWDESFGVSLEVPGHEPPVLERVLRRHLADREAAERRRLLYVAMTRARDRLLLTAGGRGPWDQPKGETLLAALAQPLRAAGVEPERIPYDADRARPPDPPAGRVATSAPRLLDEPLPTAIVDLPISLLDAYADCPARFRFAHVDGHPGVPADGEGTYARRLGTLVHRALDDGLRDRAVLRELDRLLPEAQLDEAVAMLARWDTSPAFASVRDEPADTEVAILLERGGARLTGRIDRLTAAAVIDYKTGHEAPERYHLQLWAYARAAGRSAAGLADLRLDRLVTLDASELDELDHAGDAALAGLAAGDFTARPDPPRCGRCPYAPICAATTVESAP